jgi:hypothetical protein
MWFAVPRLGHSFKLLRSSSARPNDEVTLVRPAAERLILEGSQGIEW